MNNKFIIYHGSDHVIEFPKLGLGSGKNDYGYGFYCTKDEKAAYVWANRNGGDGYCNYYEMDQSGLNVLDLTGNQFTPIHWISLLLQHRSLDEADKRRYKKLLLDLFTSYPVSLEGVDVVIGYRADDRYFRYCKDFLANQLDYESLIKALHLGKLGVQYVLLSARSFKQIRFLKAERIGKDYLHSYSELMDKANDDYQEIIENVDQRNGVFLRDKLYGKQS